MNNMLVSLTRPLLPVLYKEDKGDKLRVWKIWTQDDTVCKKYGIYEGKMIKPKPRKCYVTNEGKVSEMSAVEMAAETAKRLWIKQVDKGYSPAEDDERGIAMWKSVLRQKRQQGGQNRGVDINSDSEEDDNKEESLPKAMTGVVYNPSRKKGKQVIDWERGAYVQMKFDGIRCLALLVDDEVCLLTRGGKKLPFLSRLKKDVRKFLRQCPEGTILDGELYRHVVEIDGEILTGPQKFQLITSICKPNRKSIHEHEDIIDYHVFDMVSNKTQEKRFRDLKKLSEISHSEKIVFAEYHLSHSHEETVDIWEKFALGNYEGIMIRGRDMLYEQGRKSNQLQKFKDFDDHEFEVIGAEEGEGSEEGCVIWKLITEDGNVFNARPQGGMEDRRKKFQNWRKYVGRLGTVKHWDWTDEKVPRNPVFVGFRTDL